jgi:hypothetical protein
MPTVTGRLVNSSRTPLAFKAFQIYRKERTGSISTVVVAGTTNISGNFSVSLSTGRYEICYADDVLPFTVGTVNGTISDFTLPT